MLGVGGWELIMTFPHPVSLERRADGETELETFLEIQVVVEHVAALGIHRENQPEGHVQDRHEEADFRSRRRLERARLANRTALDGRCNPAERTLKYTNSVEK